MKKKKSEPTTCTNLCQSFYMAVNFPIQEEKNNPKKIDITDKDKTTCENLCQSWNEG